MVDVMRDLFGQLVRVGPGGGIPRDRQLSFLDEVLSTGRADPRVQVPAWMERVCKAMDANTNDLLTAHEAGQRWAGILRRRYAGKTAKQVGAALGHDWRTVQSWMGGQAPGLHVALGLAFRLKDPLILFELAGIEPPSEAEIGRELAEVQQQLQDLGARLARLKDKAP